MDDLLKDAIADAKAVRETALANAKLALEEAFTPRIQSMLSQKIQSEIDDEDEGMHADEGEDQDEESHAADEGEHADEEEAPEVAVEPEEGEEVADLDGEEDMVDAMEPEATDEEEDAEEGRGQGTLRFHYFPCFLPSIRPSPCVRSLFRPSIVARRPRMSTVVHRSRMSSRRLVVRLSVFRPNHSLYVVADILVFFFFFSSRASSAKLSFESAANACQGVMTGSSRRRVRRMSDCQRRVMAGLRSPGSTTIKNSSISMPLSSSL